MLFPSSWLECSFEATILALGLRLGQNLALPLLLARQALSSQRLPSCQSASGVSSSVPGEAWLLLCPSVFSRRRGTCSW